MGCILTYYVSCIDISKVTFLRPLLGSKVSNLSLHYPPGFTARRGSSVTFVAVEVARLHHGILLLHALLVLLSGCIYCVARYAMSRYSPDNNNCYTSSWLARARHSWDRALKWKLKLGAVKLGALIGLGVFWFDKATDVKLLLGLAVDGNPFRLLLALLVVPYVLPGYINLYWLTCTEPVKQWLSKSWLSELGNVVLVPSLPVGILLTVALDVAFFISDLGFGIPVIEQHANLEKYETFRDMGRALFGTLPTVLLQSTVLTLPVKAASDIGIADIDTFLLALVAAALPLLKVCAEAFYLALRDKNSLAV